MFDKCEINIILHNQKAKEKGIYLYRSSWVFFLLLFIVCFPLFCTWNKLQASGRSQDSKGNHGQGKLKKELKTQQRMPQSVGV